MLPEPEDFPAARRLAYSCVHDKLRQYYEDFGEQETHCHCLTHDDLCPLHDGRFSHYIGDGVRKQGGLHLNVAGIPCDDTTNWGARKGDSGPTAIVHSAFQTERGWRKEDMMITECTDPWCPDGMQHDVRNSHNGVSVSLDGPATGDFMRRKRRVATHDRTETVC